MKNSKTYITALSICSVLVISSHSATAQIEKSIDTSDFLKRYRDAVPAIEKSLYRNRHIKVDISYYSPETDGNVSKEIEFIEFKSNHDRFILHHHHSDKSFGVQLFRPDHVFSLNKVGDGKYKLVADREVPENASEQLVESPWWIHPSCTTNEGLGHGITEYELNWYSVLTAGDVPITRVVETSVNGRQVFRVDTGKAKQWKNVGM